jgi:hypothetical protein
VASPKGDLVSVGFLSRHFRAGLWILPSLPGLVCRKDLWKPGDEKYPDEWRAVFRCAALFGTGRSSLRGGFGISYERNFGNVTYNASFNPPASAVVSATCAPGDVGCTTLVTHSNLGPLGLPGPASFLPPVELRMPDPRINVAQTQFWSLALQQQVPPNSLVELSYSGAHRVHPYDVNNINQVGGGQAYRGEPLISGDACSGSGYVSFNTPANPTPVCLTRANQQFAAIHMRGRRGGSSYNALNLKFHAGSSPTGGNHERRFGRFSLRASF